MNQAQLNAIKEALRSQSDKRAAEDDKGRADLMKLGFWRADGTLKVKYGGDKKRA